MKNRYSNRGIKALLRKFETHLACWKVGLSFGSLLYFEMGRRWRAPLDQGEHVYIGSATLVLESDEWVITHSDSVIADAASIDAAAAAKLSDSLNGERLLSLQYNRDSNECHISFTHNWRIKLTGVEDEDICTLTLPDGTILGCRPTNGFYSDGSHSEPHALAYAAASEV
jgi:hypothetical protein